MSGQETVANTVIRLLKEAGADTVFGLPGGENVELMEALKTQGLRFVLVKNESSAVYMADVYSRLTGKPGVCLTTLGPGATNAFVGMAHADLDRAPVLLLTAETNQSFLPDHTHQVYDLQTIFKPICKLSLSLNPDNVYEGVIEALRLMKEGRPGPVHLSLSREMASKEAQAHIPAHHESLLIQGNETELKLAVDAMSQARTPLIIAGLGLEPSKPYKALQSFAENLSAPVIVTPKAKGALSDKHSLSAGTLGLTRTDPVYDLIEKADLIVAIGFDVVELVKPWDEKADLIWIADWENSAPELPAIFSFVGQIGHTLEQLTLHIKQQENDAEVRVSAFHKKLSQQELPVATEGRILPQQLLSTARAHLASDVLITTDVGSHKIFTALNWQAYTANRYMLSNGLSAMGFGLSAAIAGAIALGDMAVCITGDAGFSMVMGELGIIRELDLPVMIIIMNDAALDLIRSAQHRAEKVAFGTEFLNPDFKDIASAYQLNYYKITSEESCEDAFIECVEKQRACILDVLIDPGSYPTSVKAL